MKHSTLAGLLAGSLVVASMSAPRLTYGTGAIQAADVTATRMLAEASSGNNWLVNGGDFGSEHFSRLKQITDKNVGTLGLAWSLDIDSPMGLATEPLVVDGTIYLTGSLDRVYAVDAVSGKALWTFDPHVRLSVLRNSWAARTNRGAALWGRKVFVGTGDCRLIALDAATGKQLWDSPVCDSALTGITGAPRVGGGKVYIGYNGSDTGVRGSMAAFDANTGKLAWRFWNVPGDPAHPFESKVLGQAAKTWSGEKAWLVGGGAVWDAITYDEASGLLIYGTAGAKSYYGDRASMQVGGQRLYAGSIIALRADTGEYVWHYQTNSDTENFHVVVSDLNIHGARRHVVMTVPRTGIFYVLDAKSGALISQKSLAQPRTLPASGDQGAVRLTETGHNWWPMSYSSANGLVYIPAYDGVMDSEGFVSRTAGRLIAWDPIKQMARWSVDELLPVNSGVLSTAGNLVFAGEGTGEFSAYAADSGHKLWSVKTGSAIDSVPVSFTAQGRQYVIMPVGLGSGTRLFEPVSTMATPESRLGPVRLLAFRLGATTPFPYPKVFLPPVPQPPPQTASADTLKRGARVFDDFMCSDCHAPAADGGGAWVLGGTIPDLRYMPKDVHDQFLAIVLGGSHKANGMPGFGPHNDFPLERMPMSAEDAIAVHEYIVGLQWKAYDAQRTQR